jgi:hypothetical protein
MDDYFAQIEDQIGAAIAAGAHRRRGPLARVRAPRLAFGLGPLAIAGSTAIVVAIAAFVLLNVHGGRSPVATSETGREIAPALIQDFRILRTPVTSADQLPPHFADGGVAGIERGLFQRDLTHTYPGPSQVSNVATVGLLPALTRRTEIPGTGLTGWVIPGRHGLCWFTEPRSVPVPSPAECVGVPVDPATALIDGPWAGVDSSNDDIIGFVTDRVLAVRLVASHGRGRTLPLHDGFYVSPLPGSDHRIVAVTRTGIEPLYPQPTVSTTRIAGSAAKIISRSSQPTVVLTGTAGLRVQLSWEMSCMSRAEAAGGAAAAAAATGPAIKGYQHHNSYPVPAVVRIGFPTGSAGLPSCDVSAIAVVPAHGRGAVRVAITTP